MCGRKRCDIEAVILSEVLKGLFLKLPKLLKMHRDVDKEFL